MTEKKPPDAAAFNLRQNSVDQPTGHGACSCCQGVDCM